MAVVVIVAVAMRTIRPVAVLLLLCEREDCDIEARGEREAGGLLLREFVWDMDGERGTDFERGGDSSGGGEETGPSTAPSALRAVARSARRAGTRHRFTLELPDAVQSRLSSMATILLMPSEPEPEVPGRSEPESWHSRMHSPSDTSAQPSTSTLQTRPERSPE